MQWLWKKLWKKEYAIPFFSGAGIALLTHLFLFVNKFPGSDSMWNFYDPQDITTSGRWFLSIACSLTSYYDLNWMIGITSAFLLGVSCIVLTQLLKIKSKALIVLCSGIFVTFPALTATFSFLYTADGYMLGLLLAILAVYVCDRCKYGFVVGGILAAFSLGIYQAYFSATILLCIFLLIRMILEGTNRKTIWKKTSSFVLMGAIAGILYFILLKIILAATGRVLDSYQGLDNIGKFSLSSLPGCMVNAYRDFLGFLRNGNTLFNNRYSLIVLVLIALMACVGAVVLIWRKKVFRQWDLLLLLVLLLAVLPLGTNVVLLISASAENHLLMRQQWVLFPIFALVLAELWLTDTDSAIKSGSIGTDKANRFDETDKEDKKIVQADRYKKQTVWKNFLRPIEIICILAAIMMWNQMVTDNIAYFNMQERYERTYAFCLRLADRIEQTEGYEQGMPIAMIGELNAENYPNCDSTKEVTSRITGSGGSMLIYTRKQYREFFKHYLNMTIDVVDDNTMIEIYKSEEYQAMPSFPAKDSVKVVDGILYIKTE